ncbi:MAG: hypothetical protein AB1545_17325 [Thermodesulfobacteriota bacterium]|jgi:hypothetical protein
MSHFRVAVVSEPGRGTTFTVQIPVVTDAEHDCEADMTAPATLMNSGYIFVRIKK